MYAREIEMSNVYTSSSFQRGQLLLYSLFFYLFDVFNSNVFVDLSVRHRRRRRFDDMCVQWI
jgi:hypothetical protein